VSARIFFTLTCTLISFMRYVVFCCNRCICCLCFCSEFLLCLSVRKRIIVLNFVFSRTGFFFVLLPGALPRAIRCRPYRAKKSGLPCSDKPLFIHFLCNDSYFLPRYCEKFLCHHQIFFIEFIILYLSSLLYKNKKPAFEEQANLF